MPRQGQALVKQIQFLKQCAYGEVSLDVAEYGERVLADPKGEDYFAHAVIRILQSTDRQALWDRFELSLIRIYGAEWWEFEPINAKRPLICKMAGCSDLALNGVCDWCLTGRGNVLV